MMTLTGKANGIALAFAMTANVSELSAKNCRLADFSCGIFVCLLSKCTHREVPE